MYGKLTSVVASAVLAMTPLAAPAGAADKVANTTHPSPGLSGAFTWGGPHKVDATGQVLLAVSCVSQTFCVATDDVGNIEVYNDGHITVDQADSGREVTGVSCVSTSFCLAIDFEGNYTIYDGTGWSPPAPTGGGDFVGVSCVSASFCEALAQSASFTALYNGATWQFQSLGPDMPTMYAVSCATTSYCVATGAEFAFYYDGTAWTSNLQEIDTKGLIMSVSCPEAGVCVAADSSGNVLTLSNGSWSAPLSVDKGYGVFVSCAASNFCGAVGAVDSDANTGNAFSYNGTTWTKPGRTYAGAPLIAVSCPTTTFCVGVGGGGNAVVGR